MDNPRCYNCIDEVYMEEVGDGLYRCPICQDEYDATYEQDNPFDDDFDDESEVQS